MDFIMFDIILYLQNMDVAKASERLLKLAVSYLLIFINR